MSTFILQKKKLCSCELAALGFPLFVLFYCFLNPCKTNPTKMVIGQVFVENVLRKRWPRSALILVPSVSASSTFLALTMWWNNFYVLLQIGQDIIVDTSSRNRNRKRLTNLLTSRRQIQANWFTTSTLKIVSNSSLSYINQVANEHKTEEAQEVLIVQALPTILATILDF